MNLISRRNFIAAGLASPVIAANAGVVAEKINWNITVDFLVIGSGFAGLAGALEAWSIGMKNVLVVDKMITPGGNSIVNGGAISAAGTDMQAAEGIKDSPELMAADIARAGGGLAHPELGRRIAYESVKNYEWLRDSIGVKFKAVYFHGGHSVKRSHATVQGTGAGFILPMLDKCREFGIPVKLRTIVDEIIKDENGAVIGVKARENYKFGKEGGDVIYIRTMKGVLLASGGFSQNVAMRMSHDPRLTSAFASTNQPGATGEMIQEAQEIGANTVHMDWIQLGPWTSPEENGFGIAPWFVESLVGYAPMVDPATGRRFIQETGNRKVRADAIVAIGHPAVLFAGEDKVLSQVLRKVMTRETFERALKKGVFRRFETIEELASNYSIPLKPFLEEIAKFNRYMHEKKDPEFNCRFFPDSEPSEKGPYYAVRIWPRVHHTMGGVEINDRAEVLSVRGKPIPGLYAAGEVTGGVHPKLRSL